MKRMKNILTDASKFAIIGDTRNEERLLAISKEENNEYLNKRADFNNVPTGIPDEHQVKAFPLIIVRREGANDFYDIDENNFESFPMNKVRPLIIPFARG